MEGRVASDEDLKLADLLRYYMKDTAAAKVSLENAFSSETYSQTYKLFNLIIIGIALSTFEMSSKLRDSKQKLGEGKNAQQRCSYC